MARQQVVICDKCGARKKEANHWYTVCHLSGYKATAVVSLDHWLFFEELLEQTQTTVIWESKDACGMECALQLQMAALQPDQPINGSTGQREVTA